MDALNTSEFVALKVIVSLIRQVQGALGNSGTAVDNVCMTYSAPPGGFTPAPAQPPSKRKTVLILALCVAVAFGAANVVLVIKLLSNDSDKNGDDRGSNKGSHESSKSSQNDGPPTDAVDVEYDIPSGFDTDSASEIQTELEPKYNDYYMRMSGVDTYEELFVVSYLLDYDSSDKSSSELTSAVSEYGDQAGKTSDDEPQSTEELGFDAVTDHIVADGSDTKVEYDATYIFDGYYMIEVGCQYDAETETVTNACPELIDSLKW